MNAQLRNYLLLLVGCVFFHTLGTWGLPLIDRDEPRFAEASREMRERRDWIVPYFNGQYRFDKPPLTYWAQVTSYWVFGENDFAARFPSAVAAALTAVVILAWGTRTGGSNAGWSAAIIFTLSLQTFVHAKAAVADMWLVLFMTIAHWAGYEMLLQKKTLNVQRSTPNAQYGHSIVPHSVWWWSFYLSLAFAFLAKGPIGLIPLLTFTMSTFYSSRKKLSESSLMLATIITLMGLLLTFGIVSIWAIPAMIQTDWQFWKVGIGRHVIGRSLGAMEGHGANSIFLYLVLLPFYFATVFISFFPWSIKLPWLTGQLRKERDVLDNYLLWGIGLTVVIFTVVATKLPHYILPAFPPLALLLARHWNSDGLRNPVFRRLATAVAVVWTAIALALPPLIAPSFPAWELFKKARNDLTPEMEFGAVDYNEPSLVWYFRSRVRGFLTSLRKKNVEAFMAKPGPRFVIMPDSLATELSREYPVHWKTFSTGGLNLAKGKKVQLTLLMKSE